MIHIAFELKFQFYSSSQVFQLINETGTIGISGFAPNLKAFMELFSIASKNSFSIKAHINLRGR